MLFAVTLVVLSLQPLALEDDAGYQRGVELYRDLEFEQALFRFQSLAVSPERPSDERSKLLLWMGLCYAGIGQMDAARTAFEDGLRLDPSAELPEPKVSPVVVRMVEEARTRVKAAPPPAKSVAPTPPPAEEGVSPSPTSTDPVSSPADPPGAGEAGDAEGAPGQGGLPWLLIAGGGVAAGGVVVGLLAAGTVAASGGVFAMALSAAGDPERYAAEVNQTVFLANVLLVAGAGLGALTLGTLALGAGVAAAGLVVE